MAAGLDVVGGNGGSDCDEGCSDTGGSSSCKGRQELRSNCSSFDCDEGCGDDGSLTTVMTVVADKERQR
ncbi:hypothetical protein E2562_026929 [Oryza meyeriana var. granulata]|uniref:Uncharacterized protein n=1 Tax=Oryza meyeriana var. granulata TaxID=110450 RepID=A0A6G1EZC0_9ORYZ|nr:hypothetical protein E2562_026929 [Oryza meyeriana var. granulata]